MKLECMGIGARCATLLLADGGLYETLRPYQLTLNGRPWGEGRTVITTLYGLSPDTAYELVVWNDQTQVGSLLFHTDTESYTLDVRRFGAVGDGVHEDTAAIQAAILSCPPDGRVLIPRGRYLVTPLFLKSHLRLEIAKGAELLLMPDRDRLPILPGTTESWDERDELHLGTWEGNPLDMYAALLNGIDVTDATVYGEGVLNGQGDIADWWREPKKRRGAWRGRLLFLCRCSDVTVAGLSFTGSPSWNIHPYFSQRLRFYGIRVTAPANSPNTDGFDPESSQDVLVAGAAFSLGDDCIAIKSGKLYMGRKYHTPSARIEIAHCLMENGHGGVTIGSEVAGGVHDVTVRSCLMRHTDRGLRIKTRRGRGQTSVLDNIRFENVTMEDVGAPLTVNALYFCDPDGHSPYVQSREALPVDERTPLIGRISFCDVRATGCGACAAYLLGLPERPIEAVRFERVQIQYAAEPKPMQPVMADGVPACARCGIVAENVQRLTLADVVIRGQAGEPLLGKNVGEVVWEGRA